MEFQEEEMEFLNGIEIEEEKTNTTKGTSIIPFIQTLYAILQEKTNEQYIMWSPEDEGKSFYIKDAIIFSKELLPRYYKHTNFCGFARQLQLYGFKKYEDSYKYENEYFQKDKFELLKNIQRRKPQSQRKKQNNTTTLYQQLLTQLMGLQKQNLDTNQQINTLKETLYGLKLREENLEMRMQRLQDTLSIDQNAFMFFTGNTSQIQRMNDDNNNVSNSNAQNANNNQNNNRENNTQNQQQNENQSQNPNFMSWSESQNPQLSWKF